MATGKNARVREISRQLAPTLRTAQGMGGWLRFPDLLARDAMKRPLPDADEEIRNAPHGENRKKHRAQIKPILGAFILRAHPRESDNAREILNDRTARDTQDTRISTNATSSNATRDDTEQQTLPTQATLIRH